MKKRIAIFASGSGSNAQKIMEHFKRSSEAEVVLILTNNPQAYVLKRADKFDEGEILHQSRFKIEPGDNIEMIKFKGQQLEHHHFPRVIESLLKKMKS